MIERDGPSIGIGVGAIYGDRREGGGVGYDDSPRYFRVLDNADYWEWVGESTIRLSLTYQSGVQTFTHLFTIQRVKAK